MAEAVEQPTVEQWLDDVEIGHKPFDLEGEDGYRWAILAESRPFNMVIAQREAGFPCLTMQVSLSVAENHRETLRALDADTRDRFLFDLRITLLQKPVGHNLVYGTDEPEIPVQVLFVYNLFEVPPERSGFMRRHHQLQQAAQLAGQMFQKLERFNEWK